MHPSTPLGVPFTLQTLTEALDRVRRCLNILDEVETAERECQSRAVAKPDLPEERSIQTGQLTPACVRERKQLSKEWEDRLNQAVAWRDHCRNQIRGESEALRKDALRTGVLADPAQFCTLLDRWRIDVDNLSLYRVHWHMVVSNPQLLTDTRRFLDTLRLGLEVQHEALESQIIAAARNKGGAPPKYATLARRAHELRGEGKDWKDVYAACRTEFSNLKKFPPYKDFPQVMRREWARQKMTICPEK